MVRLIYRYYLYPHTRRPYESSRFDDLEFAATLFTPNLPVTLSAPPVL